MGLVIKISRVGWGGCFIKSTGGGVGHAGVGWVMQRWSGVSHTGVHKNMLVLRIKI